MKKKYFKLEIITPNGIVYAENVVHVRAPGINGRFGVLMHHMPFMFLLKTGHIEIDAVGPNTVFAVTHGYARLADGVMKVVVESAHDAKKIDIKQVQKDKERAEKLLASKREKMDKSLVHFELEKALNKLAAVEKVKRQPL